MKAIVTISANASQNEQSCIGPNNLTRQLVSEASIDKLLDCMLLGGSPLTVGVGMIIEVIRKNNSDYDPDVGAGPDSAPSNNDPIYLGSMLRCFAKRVPKFMELLLSPTHAIAAGDSQITIKRQDLDVAFGKRIEPLGFDRFKTCELMAELLHCSNMGLLNERGSEAYVKERDQERERLRREGTLLSRRPPPSATTEFSEDTHNFMNGNTLELDTTSESNRKLAVANSSAEDDGFEDVGTSADLAEEARDDFDEKSPTDIEPEPVTLPNMPRPTKPRLDLDEDFVDEPLTSPRLEALDEKDPGNTRQGNTGTPPYNGEPEPVTSHQSPGVEDLPVKDETLTVEIEQTPMAVTKSPEPIAALDQLQRSETPPLPHRDRQFETLSPEPGSSRGLSPHPDDEPAPLFSSRSEQPLHDEDSATAPQGNLSPGPGDNSFITAHAEEDDSSRSAMISGNEGNFTPQFEYDVDGQPIVGDYLKMMFVEHQVVPTILVSF